MQQSYEVPYTSLPMYRVPYRFKIFRLQTPFCHIQHTNTVNTSIRYCCSSYCTVLVYECTTAPRHSRKSSQKESSESLKKTLNMGYLDNVKVPKVKFDSGAARSALVGASAGIAVASEAAQGCAKYALDLMKVSRSEFSFSVIFRGFVSLLCCTNPPCF